MQRWLARCFRLLCWIVFPVGHAGLRKGRHAGVAGECGAQDVERISHLPVLLVIDVSRQAQSAEAVVRGFAAHDLAVRIAGRNQGFYG